MVDYCWVFLAEVKILRMFDLSQQDEMLDKQRSTVILNAPVYMQFQVAGLVIHLGLNCDDLLLTVVVENGQGLSLLVYDTRAFADKVI